MVVVARGAWRVARGAWRVACGVAFPKSTAFLRACKVLDLSDLERAGALERVANQPSAPAPAPATAPSAGPADSKQSSPGSYKGLSRLAQACLGKVPAAAAAALRSAPLLSLGLSVQPSALYACCDGVCSR